MTKPTDQELASRFVPHTPPMTTSQRRARDDAWRAIDYIALEAAVKLRDICPEGRNLELALTHLEDVHTRAQSALIADPNAIGKSAQNCDGFEVGLDGKPLNPRPTVVTETWNRYKIGKRGPKGTVTTPIFWVVTNGEGKHLQGVNSWVDDMDDANRYTSEAAAQKALDGLE